MKLEDFKVYQMAMEIGSEIWDIVIKWDYFAKDTIGKQFVRAIDSVAANLSEGFGRYHYKEAKILVITQEVHYMNLKHG